MFEPIFALIHPFYYLVPPAPLSLKAVSIGSETLKVRWSPIDLKDFHGNLLSYELQYFEGDFKQAAKVISDIPVGLSVFIFERFF